MKREDWFVFSDVDNNNNKFWKITQNDNVVTTEWGRVEDNPQVKSWDLGSEYGATREYDKKCKEKTRKGYEKVDVPKTAGSTSRVISSDIDVDSEDTKSLIQYLTDVNIHNITENTSMTYNNVQGVFTTPLGVVVSQSTIDRARTLLSTVKTHILKKDFTSDVVKNYTNQYLRLIPQNLGRAANKISVAQVFDGDKLLKQADILDSLEASLKTVLSTPTDLPADEGVVFSCKVHQTKDNKVIDEVVKLYEGTRQSVHISSKFKVNKIYVVEIPTMKLSWESYGVKLDNIRRLWHGTKPSNVLSILKKGLIIPPSSASFVAGRVFGDGLYFSDQSTKSLNYAYGYWDGNYVNRCFMFLADVALGKYYIPKGSYDGPFPKSGYDSTYAVGGQSGVMNNEFIVPRTSQCNLVYLVEFK